MRSLVFIILILGIGASTLAGCSGGSTEGDAKKSEPGFTKKGATKATGGRAPDEPEPPTLPPGSYSSKPK
jgi:hypothetical protein